MDVGAVRAVMVHNWEQGASLYAVLTPDGKPLAVLGADAVFPKSLELYSFVDKSADLHRVGYAKSVRTVVESLWEEHAPNRMQMVVNSKYAWAEKWATFLGFQKESTLRKYGPDGEDFYMYARVRENG
jgi:hypothetical protein